MNLFKRTTTSPIGLDIGRHAIKAVQLTSSAARPAITAATRVQRDGTTTTLNGRDIAGLRQTLKSTGFTGNDIVIAAPHDQLLTAFLELPPRETGAPIEQIAKMEFARMHRCGPNELEMSFWDLPAPARAAASTHVMAAGCKHQDADAMIDVLENAGFYVRAIDTHAWSLLRACAPLLPEHGTAMILDMGHTAARLILANNRMVAYERTLPDAGGGDLIDQVSKRAGADPRSIQSRVYDTPVRPKETTPHAAGDKDPVADAVASHCQTIADEVRVSLSFAAHRYPDATLSQVLLVGGGAAMPQAAGFFEETLEVPTRKVALADVADDRDEPPWSTAAVAAAGLAKFTES